jgi:hypothetical protein
MWRSSGTAIWRKLLSIALLFNSEYLIKGDHAPFVYNLATAGDLETSDRAGNTKGLLNERVFNGSPTGLGALATKREPGKVRVFAMVDSVTQWLLRPLHQYLFKKVLRVIPQDGLYDQVAPAKKLVGAMRKKGLSRVWSYDLSAATDRLPLVLQEHLLRYVVSIPGAALWSWLIADRWFRLPSDLWDSQQGKSRTPSQPGIKYSVGQPMGAYSSWALLALTHHAIVQYCAKQAGVAGWFDLYALLGDDIVIGHSGVARKYVLFMAKVGVPLNRHKSIAGRNLSFEFAKRFFWRGEDLTPLPLSGFTSGWLGLSAVPEILAQLKARGLKVSLYSVYRYVGIGFKQASGVENKLLSTMSGRARALWLMLSLPGGPFSVGSMPEWFTQIRKGVSKSLDGIELVAWVQSIKSRLQKYELDFLIQRAKKALKAYEPVGEGKFEYDSALKWWRVNVRSQFLDPFRERIADLQLAIVELHHMGSTGLDMNVMSELYTQIELMEDLFALLPGQLRAKRRQTRNLIPARVREWKRTRLLIPSMRWVLYKK